MNPKSIAAPRGDTQHIPAELRARPQWALAGDDKSPLMINGGHAKSTDPRTWGTYDDVCAAANPGQFIGYMLSPDDPFACIDLDVKDYTTQEQIERFERIVACFDSYTEWSRSGRGLHIWVEGKVGNGRKRDGVEVYSQARFIVCTGNVLVPKPITQRQRYLEILHAELTRGTQIEVELEDDPDGEPDYEVAQIAFADEGELGRLFRNGAWEGKYPSASEADLALVTMLARLTTSNNACWGAFQMSPLGKRVKDGKVKSTRQDYRRTTLAKARTYLANEAVEIAHGQEIADALFFRIQPPAATVAGALTAKPLRQFLDESIVVEFLMDGVFRRGWLYTITGMTGAGKTGIAVFLALAVAAGKAIDKDHGIQQGPVLYIAGENADDVRGRFQAMLVRIQWPEEAINSIHVIDQSFLLEERLADLLQIIGTVNPIAIFVDTDQAVSLHGDGEENSNNSRMKHAKNLRQLTRCESRPTIIDLCHPNSSAKSDQLRPRGGSSFLNEIDGNVRCWRDEPNTTLASDFDKWRGTAFELSFCKEDIEVGKVVDQHGRKIRLPVYLPATDEKGAFDNYNAYSERLLLLRKMAQYPQMNQVSLLQELGWKTKGGDPDKPKISRLIKRLREEDPPLVSEHGNLTAAGKKAAKGF